MPQGLQNRDITRIPDRSDKALCKVLAEVSDKAGEEYFRL